MQAEPAYIAGPAGGGPGVLVLHAWWGLSDGIRRYCDRLAESDRPEAYDAAAASLAFRRTVGFLQSQHPGR